MLAGVKINARCSTVLFARLAMCVCVCVCVCTKSVCVCAHTTKRLLTKWNFCSLENVYFEIFQEEFYLFIYLFILKIYIFKFSKNIAIRFYLFIYLFIFIVYVCKLSPTSQMIIFYLFFRSSNLFADGKFRSNGM